MKQKQKRKQRKTITPLIEALEPRVLFSADVFGGAIDGPVLDDPLATLLDDAAAALEKQATHTHDEQTDSVGPEALPEDESRDAGARLDAEVARKELIIVDSATPDYPQLVEDLLAQVDNSRQVEIAILDADRDGVSQVSEILEGHSGLDAVHFISHASDGAVSLGNSTLEFETLGASAREIKAWGEAVTADGDILIYGCNLAASPDGQSLVDGLAELTGADVAASDDLTGSAELGGDWELEHHAGPIETSTLFSELLGRDWTGTLDTAQVSTEYLVTPLAFEQNTGQTDSAVDFLSRGDGYSVFLTDGDAVLVLSGSESQHVVRLDLVGANANPNAIGQDQLGSNSNYLIGRDESNWRTNVDNFASVYYESIYDGIDLRYYGNQRQLEYDFVVEPGGDADAIRLSFDGVLNAEVTESGELRLILNEQGDATLFKAPISYQTADDGTHQTVASQYVIHADGTVGFELGQYDAARDLVIDPVLDYLTFIGGTGYEVANGIAVDDSGNAYITGYTASTDFPTTVGALSQTHAVDGGSYDIYVAKLSADGGSLVYSTFIGGDGTDYGYGIAVDGSGNAYVAGLTYSTDLPTVNAFQGSLNGTMDAYVLKLNASGNALLYSSYFGGSGTNEVAQEVVLDSSGVVYIAGYTASSDLPLKNALDSTLGGTQDAFVAKFDLTQTGSNSLLYSTYFGGSNNDSAHGLDVDSAGNFYISGGTESTDLTTVNAYDSSQNVGDDIFLAKFNSSGSALLYSSYLGGGGNDHNDGLAVDDSGNAYLAGRAMTGFSTTAGAYDTSHNGGTYDAIVAKFDTTLSGSSSLSYSTYLGGGAWDMAYGLDIDSVGNVYVTGATASLNHPTTADGNDRIRSGDWDGFLTVLDATGTSLVYSTYLGGSANDRGYGVTLDSYGAVNVIGYSETNDTWGGTSPTTLGPGGGTDAFVAKITFNQAPTATDNSYTVAEGGTLNGNVISDNTGPGIDSDPDADPLTASLVEGPLHGTLVLNANGSFTYTPFDEPVSNFADSDSFTYQVSDSKGGTDIATVTITVTPDATNEAPVNSVPGSQNVNQDSALVFSAGNGNRILPRDDAGGNNIQLTLTATNGTVTLAATTGLSITGGADGSATVTVQGSLTDINDALNGLAFTPTAAFFGSASLQVATNDLGQSGGGVAESDTDVISITVTEVNYTPVITSDGGGATAALDVEENNIAVTTVTATDTNPGDTLSYSISGTDAGLFEINSSSGALTFKNLPDFENPVDAGLNNDYEVTVSVSDGNGGTNSQDLTVTVTQVVDSGSAVWSNTSTTPQTSSWAGNSFGSTTGTVALSDNYRTMQGADAPTRDEKIVVGIDASGNVTGEMWNGSSWSALPLNNLGTVSETYWWGVEVAYEQLSGDAIIVWNDNNQSSGDKLRYAVWNGSSWSTPQSIGAYAGAEPQNLKLAFDPGSDAMVLIVDDVNADDYALVWDGASWGNAITLDTSGTAESDQSAIAVAFEAQSGDALVSYGKNGDTDVFYRIWNGSGWATEASLTAAAGVTGEAKWLVSATDHTSDRIVLGTLSAAGEVWLSVWDGSAWETSVLAEPGATGTNHPKLAVAFESTTGQAVATYADGAQSLFHYRTWDAGSGWSSELNGPSIGAVPNTMTLDSGPTSDHIMLSIQDASSDLHYLRWDGSAWSTDNELSTNTGEVKNRPFVFIYDQDGLLVDPNAAPVNTIPGTQNTALDTPLVFSTGNGNAISVADTDDSSVEVTLTATNGTVTLSGLTGLSFSSGDGSADATMTFIGTLVDVNAALAGLQFAPIAAFEGFASVQISTTDFAGGGPGGAKTDVDAVTVEVGDVNTPPVNAVPTAQTIDQDGMLLFSSATGTAISISDVDAGSNPVQVTLTAANGTLNLAGAQGLTFSTGDGTADASMTFAGTVADINAALEGATFVAAPGYLGAASVQITVDDQGNTGAGGALSDTDTVAIAVSPVYKSLLLTTTGSATSNPASGSVSWNAGDLVSLGDPSLTFEPINGTTSGTFTAAPVFSLDPFAGRATNVNGVHHITSDMTVGSNAVALREGDLLFVTSSNETLTNTDLTTLAVTTKDIVAFRPTTPGAYGTGNFFHVVRGADVGLNNITGFSVVEQNTTVGVGVGSTTLSAGDFIIAHTGAKKQIDLLTPGVLGGAATNTGALSLLVDGADIGVGQEIFGLELIESNTTLGGTALQSGQILATLKGEAAVGDNGIATTRQDVFILDITQTGATTIGDATLLLQGNDIGLDTGNSNEDVWGIGMVSNQAASPNSNIFAVDENSPNGTVVGAMTGSDPDSDPFKFAITAGNTDGAFAIDATTGQITVANSAALDFETTPSFALTVAAIDAEGAYDTATVTVNLNDLVENTAPTTSGISNFTVNEDTGFSFIDLKAVFDDIEDADSALVYSVQNNSNAGLFDTMTISGAGVLKLDYATDQNGTADITVRATDTGGLFVETTFTVTVDPINDAPTTTPVTLTAIAEDSGVRLITQAELLANAADVEGDSLTATGLAISAGSGALVDNGNGTWNYTPAADDDTAVAFSYSITDGSDTVAGSASLDITAVNDAPIISAPATATAAEETALVFSVANGNPIVINDVDAGAGLISVSVSVTNGTATLASIVGVNTVSGDGTDSISLYGNLVSINNALDGLTFVATTNFDESSRIQIDAYDFGNTGAVFEMLDDSHIIDVTITPVNDAPVTVADAYTVAEDETLTVAAPGVLSNDSDPDSTDPAFSEEFGSSGSLDGEFANPGGMEFDSAGNLYIADTNNDRIQVFDADGNHLLTFGAFGSADGQLDKPADIAIDSNGNIYVADNDNSRVQKFDSAGNHLLTWGTNGTGDGQFQKPVSIAVDTVGNVYVVDSWTNNVQKFDSTGNHLLTWGGTGSADGQFNTPLSIAVDANGIVWVGELSGDRIQQFDTFGNHLLTFGSGGSDIGELNGPSAIAIAADGNAYVSDNFNHRVQAFDPSGNYILDWGSYGTGMGQFQHPQGVAVDSTGRVWVADANNNRIQVFAEPESRGEPLTATLVTGPGHSSSFTLNTDGSFTYTPSANWNGTDSFVYEAADGNGGVTHETVSITVTSVNDGPTTSPVTLTAMAEDSDVRLITQAELLANATDIEGDGLIATDLAISAGYGSLVDNGNGTWNYTPALNDDTNVSFSYSITDSTDTAAGSASMDITPVNDAPTTTPVTLAAVAEDSGIRLITQAELLSNSADTEGDSLTATGLAISAGSGTLFDNGDGTWNYTPALDDDTAVSFSYSITDGTDTAAGSANLDITPVNDAPTTSPVTLSAIAEDSGVRLISQAELLSNASDTEGDSLTATGLVISTGSGTLVDNGDGTWNYTPALNDDTAVSFSYSIADGTDTAAGSATLDITPVNDAPTTSPVTLTAIAEDSGVRLITQAELLSNASDVEGNGLTATGLSISAGSGTLFDNGDGTWNYTPSLNDDTAVSFSYIITDGTDTAAGSASMDITPVNDAPTTTPVTLTAIAEDSGVRLITQAELLSNASDTEGDSLTATGLAISAGSGTLFDNGDGTWNYTPALNDDASVAFSYSVTDGTDTAAGSANLDITPVNDAPTTTPVTLTAMAEDSGVRLITQAELLADASDIEGDSLTATGLSLSAGSGTLVDNLDGTWNYTPALNDDTAVSFSYNITDGVDTVAGSATLDITPVNDAPTTSPVTLTAIAEDSGVRLITQAELLSNAADTEGDSLTATGLAISAGSGSLVDNGDGTWNYTPALNDDTAVSFSYNITDGADTVAGSATLDITPVNDAPTTSPVTLTAIAEDSGVRLITQAELLANASDIEGDSLTATGLAISAGSGTLFDNGDGTWNYTPALNDDSAVSFSYNITDGTDSAASSATLDITPVNDAPTTSPVTLTAIAEDSGVRLITQAELLSNASDIEGDSLTATGLAISAGSGTLFDNGDGTWNYTPAADDDTAVSFSYSITDGTDTAAGSATLDITPVNDAPTTLPVTLVAIAEDSGVRLITQVELLTNASDIEGDSLTATGLAISAGSGTLFDNGDGTWNYTPAADDDTAVSFSYSITDGTDTVVGSATLDITPVNDAPTTTPVTLAAIAEDSGVRLITQAELLANASDIEGDSLTATGLAISAGSGTLFDNGDGTWNYTPALNDDASVAFSYSVTDGTDTVVGSATLDITPVNDAPTTTPVSLTAIAEDSGPQAITQAELLANAGDIEGDSLTATSLTISTGSGTLVDNGDGTWDYTPALNDDTNVSFSYSITDGTDTAAGSANLDITPVNDAPTTSPVTLVAIAEDSGVRLITQAELLANASDVEGDSLSATGLAISAGSGTLFDNGDGTWNYTPTADDDTAVSFSYNITDGTDTAAGSANLDITPVNDAPTTTPVALAAIAEDSGIRLITQVELLANASDIEGDSLTATGLAISAGSGTLFDNGDGTWNYTPSLNDDTAVSFSYSITDGTDTAAGSASMDIAPVNDAPTTTPVTLTAIAEDSGVRLITQAELLSNASDTEGDSLTATGLAISAGSGTLFDNGDGTWNYTPALNDDASVAFSYSVTDGTDTVVGSATLDITPVNDAPTTTPVSLTAIAEDSGVRLITQAELLADASDIEGDSLTATGLAISAGSGTLFDNGDGTWNYTPALNDDTAVSFSYSITDGTDTAAGSATLDITPVNDVPTTTPVTLAAIAEDSGVRLITQAELLANASDIEGDSLTATGLAISAGSGTLFDNGDGTWNYTPALNDDASVAFSYSVTDGTDTVVGSATLDITPVNDAPTTTPVSLTAIAEDSGPQAITQAELLANAGDIEGDSLTATSLTISTGSGTLVDNGDGTWDYTPALNDDTNVSFSYSITDGTDTAAGSANLDITPVNDAPTTSPVTLVAIAEDSGVRLITQAELLANASDVEGDSLSATGLAISAGSGTLFDNGDGTWNYTPAADDDTAVSFSYSITDGTDTAAGSATLDITPVNDAPTTSPVTLVAIAEDSGVRLITQAELLANASDIESDSLTATDLAISAGSGTLFDNGDGTWNYTPAADDDTAVSLSYNITDGTDTAAGSASMDITPVNDAPTSTPVTLATIAEDSGARLITQAELLTNASDIEGDSLTATGLAISAGSGTLFDNGDGTWNYTPALNDDTAVSFSYNVTDGADTVAGSATLDITPVNDAPSTSPVTLTAIAEDSGVRLITQAELLSNAADTEGDSLTATGLAISAGSGTLFDNGDGTWNYTPALNDDTAVSFSYNITDGADTVAGSATLDITPVNDAPTTSPVTLTAIAEDSGVRLITQAELLANASDVEGDSLSATGLAISAGSGTLVDNGNGTWNYTPALNDDTSVSFSYSITDGTDTVAGSATLDITPVNDVPTTTPVALTGIAEDSGVRLITQAELLANASDIEGDSLTATGLTISAGSGTLFDNGDGTWNYTPALNDDTSASFSYNITDGADTVAGSATLDITPVNDAPTTSPVTLTAIAEDSGARVITQAELLANASDVEGDSLSATGLTISAGLGSLVDNGDGTWNYTPALNDDTAVSFSYSITDGTDTVAGSATLDITPVNDAPTTTPVTLAAIAEDSGVRLITQAELLANASDVEGDSLSAAGLAISAGSGTLVDNGNGTWNYTPALNDDTSVSFSYSMTDGTDTTAGSATLDIMPVNDAPSTTPVSLTAIAEDSGPRTITQAELLANARDIEGDGLTATGLSISGGAGTLVDNGDGTWDFTSALNDDTSVSFSYSITDGTDTTAGSATLDITPVNDAPTTPPVTLVAIAEDSGVRLITQAELLASASDIEGDSLTAAGLAISAGAGTLVDNGDGTWYYTPALNDDTAVSFSYSITDGTDTVAGSATMDITSVNDVPVIGGTNSGHVTEDVDADLDSLLEVSEILTIIDPDSGDARFQAETLVGTYGSLEIDATGNWSYAADNTQALVQQLDTNESILDVLTVTTADGTNHRVTVTITGAEDASVIDGTLNGAVAEDGQLIANGALSISDVDRNDSPIFPDEVATLGDNGYGEFVLTGGTWTYILNNSSAFVQALGGGEILTDTHTFTASDGSTQSVTITINGAEETDTKDGGLVFVGDSPSPTRIVSTVGQYSMMVDRWVGDGVDGVKTSNDAAGTTKLDSKSEGVLSEQMEDGAGNGTGNNLAAAVASGGGGIVQPVDSFILTSVLSDASPQSGKVGYRVSASELLLEGFLDLPNLDIAPYDSQSLEHMGQNSILDNDSFVASLEALDQDLEEAVDKQVSQSRLRAEAVIGMTLSISAGFVSWVLRAGSLFASLLSVLPLWRQFDPLPILGTAAAVRRAAHKAEEDGEQEDESGAVERIFDQDKSG